MAGSFSRNLLTTRGLHRGRRETWAFAAASQEAARSQRVARVQSARHCRVDARGVEEDVPQHRLGMVVSNEMPGACRHRAAARSGSSTSFSHSAAKSWNSSPIRTRRSWRASMPSTPARVAITGHPYANASRPLIRGFVAGPVVDDHDLQRIAREVLGAERGQTGVESRRLVPCRDERR
jgi:hypothetical protein